MKTKILIIIADGKIVFYANGNAEIYVEHLRGLKGAERVKAIELPDVEFEGLLRGKEPEVIL
jgi:hypothetical protein